MDIDLLGRTSNEVESIVQLMREVVRVDVPKDGIVFDSASFAGGTIREDADYPGVRITFTANLAAARIHMQLDIGFGDVVTPGPEKLSYPTILDFPSPELFGYSRETVIAEKLQALVHLRMLNSRMKDYYDLWLLSQDPDLNIKTLRDAVQRTFRNRNTAIEAAPMLGSRRNSATIHANNFNGEPFSNVQTSPKRLRVWLRSERLSGDSLGRSSMTLQHSSGSYPRSLSAARLTLTL